MDSRLTKTKVNGVSTNLNYIMNTITHKHGFSTNKNYIMNTITD